MYWGLHCGRAPTVRVSVHASRHPLSSPRLEFRFFGLAKAVPTGLVEEALVRGGAGVSAVC